MHTKCKAGALLLWQGYGCKFGNEMHFMSLAAMFTIKKWGIGLEYSIQKRNDNQTDVGIIGSDSTTMLNKPGRWQFEVSYHDSKSSTTVTSSFQFSFLN
jgi:hypothetical protein